jgi:methane/ammonia monooxygenase subunit A
MAMLERAASREELRELLTKRYVFIDRKWDLVFWVTAAFVVGAAQYITYILFAGDWDFWTDWKDRLWWPTVMPFATIIIPSALQYIQWRAWRFSTGATYTTLSAWFVVMIGRLLWWNGMHEYPVNFILPETFILAALVLDWILLMTRSYILTSVIGAPLWALVLWASNYVLVWPFMQPAAFMGHVMTLADIQGIAYIRTATPEYLRIIETGSLRTFLGQSLYVALAFGATLAAFGYWIGQFIGRYLAVWPIGRTIKTF